MHTFRSFQEAVAKEAAAEGPDAARELERNHAHFRLAREIGDARRKAGWSQSELARRSGVPQSEISRIEGGRANSTEARLLDLLAPLGMTLEVVADRFRKGPPKARAQQKARSRAGRSTSRAPLRK